ncbi:hypothetical protein [Pseudomonas sp. RW405]|uniref:hypothetical protein n=1 Tax=Pseudomonas sp. RW405 TaxID=2202652 RepID=UPI001304AC1C|nr:hypothetical protein [Pseudomonas sp. RW405]
MKLKEGFKTLRAELSKKADTKTVPAFIITGLEKLGYLLQSSGARSKYSNHAQSG